MTIKIGLIFQDSGFENINLEYPENGNPGIGGTQFCFIMLAKYLKKTYNNIEVHIFHCSPNFFSKDIKTHIVKEEIDAVKRAKKNDIDILIIKNGIDEKFIDAIEKYDINTIVWAHNYLFADELKLITNSKKIVRLIFVGKEQYDRYIDDKVIKKSTYIYNMFKSKDIQYIRNYNYELNVTYTGSLIYSKGFHVLAKEWKKILKKVPTANLIVIGSGKLYNRNSSIGKYNIADECYENLFMPYLTDKTGNVLPPVRFCGVLGQEKEEIYQNTAVGVVNPSGKTETFGLSVVEMASFGIPVVTKATNGLLDTVVHNKTGFLFHSNYMFRKKVIKLLRNRELNNKIGSQAKNYVLKFEPENIIEDWYNIFVEILSGREANYIKPKSNFFNNYKWLRVVNRSLATNLGIYLFPSVINLESKVSKMIGRLK